MEKEFEIWMEGYLVSGTEGVPAKAQRIGSVKASTFRQACDKLCSPEEWQSQFGNYNANCLTVWGCRLFDNEADARKSFG